MTAHKRAGPSLLDLRTCYCRGRLMHPQRHDEKRKNRKKRTRRRYLLLFATSFGAMAISAFPLYVGLNNIEIDSFSPTMLTSHRDSSITAPCACNFGTCLQWDIGNMESHFPCATLFPLRWYETWDATTKAWYFRHKRTMHFEVINLIRDSEYNSTSCDYPHMITYFHIFKNGGTTIRNAFRKEQTALPYEAKILFTGIQSRIGTGRFHERLNNTVSRLYKGQQLQTKMEFGFTFLRDPVTRFLSGMGQVLNKFMYGILTDSFPLAPCFYSNLSTTEMLDCSLEELMPMVDSPNNSEAKFYDFHLLPQSFLLRDFSGELDISIMVMDMKHIQNVLHTLIPHPPVEGATDNLERTFWARPSRSADYTGGYDLKNPEILTMEQKRQICRLYHMDVKLLAATKVLPDSFCFQ